MKDIYILYKNYLTSIQYHKEFGEKYGDTLDLILSYEHQLEQYGISTFNYAQKESKKQLIKKKANKDEKKNIARKTNLHI